MQLDIVHYLAAHADRLLGAQADAPISTLDLYGPPGQRADTIVSVDPNAPTLLAFDYMLGAGVSGAPVVSPQGELVANLSVSDLRCIQPEHLGVLALPVAEFLALLHRTTYLGYSQGGSKSKDHPFFAGSPGSGHRSSEAEVSAAAAADAVRLITVTPNTTLREVLHQLGDNRIHRLYCVDPNVEGSCAGLVGVVTPTDVLCWLAGVPRLPPPPPSHSAIFRVSSVPPPTPTSTPLSNSGATTPQQIVS
ncbi:hypothetical protein FOA52_011699 [Chlamydomonas sp. UWO 241]|nr:hypothetical protein FOA52_011699 [Chlamydomonas sp. UWO 241]